MERSNRPPARQYKGDPTQFTTQDCIDQKWSGIRVNKLNGMTELWVAGEKRVENNTQLLAGNPGLLANMYEEAFATWGSLVEVDTPIMNGIPQPRAILKPKGGR